MIEARADGASATEPEGPADRASAAVHPWATAASGLVSWQPTQPRTSAGLEAEERPHSPQLHLVAVEELEVDRGVDGHAEVGAPVALHGHSPRMRTGVQCDHDRLDVGS